MTSKIVYQTNYEGFYIGPVEADESPLEPGIFPLPAGCVEIPPPQIPAGYLARFVDDSWFLEEIPVAPELEPERPKTAQEIISDLTNAVQLHMDTAARALGYDDIKSVVTYADEPAVPKFQQEGLAFRAWRSLVWAKCYEVLEAIQSEQRPIPSAEELIAELPALEVAEA